MTTTLGAADSHATERLEFTRRSDDRSFIRVRDTFTTTGVAPELLYSFLKSFSHAGWRQAANASFGLVAISPAGEWSPRTGNSHVSEVAHTEEPCKYLVGNADGNRSIWHSAPPGTETFGWTSPDDLLQHETYTITQAVVVTSDYVFESSFYGYVHSLAPPVRHFRRGIL
jgi:hypothetical protein